MRVIVLDLKDNHRQIKKWRFLFCSTNERVDISEWNDVNSDVVRTLVEGETDHKQ